MAYFIGDGFDHYGGASEETSDVGVGGGWTGGLTLSTVTQRTRFGYGKSLSQATFGNQVGLYKSGGPNSSTWFICLAYETITALSGTAEGNGVQLHDGTPGSSFNSGSTAQVSIIFRSDGAIIIRSGHGAGTAIATFAGAFVANSFDHWQFKIVIHNTAGSISVRKNGATTDTFSATSVNTRGGTANAWANCVSIGTNNTASSFIDDFLCFDNSGSTLFSDWVGDVRAWQLAPAFDTAQKQFTQNTTGSLALSFGTTSPTTQANAANALYVSTGGVMNITQGGTLSSLTAVFNAGFTGKCKFAFYDAYGDQANFTVNSKPGRLVAVSDEVVNPTSTQVFNFSTPLNMAKGRGYYPAILTDTAWTALSSSNPRSVFTIGVSYVGGFPADLTDAVPTSSGSAAFIRFTATLTATNAGIVSDDASDAGVTFLSDPTVGHYDLWDVENLPYTPSKILGVVQRTLVSKSDAGTKGVKNVLKTGGTEYLGVEYNPLTVYGGLFTTYATNPSTGANWAATDVNAIQIGVKVTS